MGPPGSAPDRYRRVRPIGEGGAARVWLVEDRLRPGATVALKEPLDDDPRSAAALRREYAWLARFRHPGLVEVFEFDRAPDTGAPRFTLDYVDGDDVTVAVGREGAGACLEAAAEALRVLALLHDFGLVHRDLKPGNLLVRTTPRLGCRVVLLDLGLSLHGDEMRDASRGPAGTLPYLAPELFAGVPASPRSDLYALGAVFYEATFGRPPAELRGRPLAEFIESVRQGRRSRSPLPAGYPEGFARWLDELLSPDPEQRPVEAREALGRLNAACGTTFALETPASRAGRLAADPPAGRDAEFAEIWSILEPRTGPRVVWLVGAAGVGKSRMLRWLRSEAILRGWEVATGRGATLDELRRAAGAQPLVWLLDEVESADAATVERLDRVAREAKAPPLQVVAAVRAGEPLAPRLRRLLADTGTVPTLRRIELGALSVGAIRAIAERALGSKALSSARIQALARASEGHPLLVEELLVEGAVAERAPRSASPARTSSVAARFALLSDPGRAWLEALCVLGRGISESAVATLAGLAGDAAARAREENRLAGLGLVEQGACSPASRVVAATLLAELEPAERQALHRRAAGMLEGAPPPDGDRWRLAKLWAACGEPALALACAVEAARQAQAEGSPERAAERFAFALAQCPRRGPVRLAVRREHAEALLAAGHHAAAARAFGAALRLTRERSERADLLARQSLALGAAGRFARAAAVAEQALALAGTERPLERAHALDALAAVHGRLGRERDALPLFAEALAIARELRDVPREAEALRGLATCKARLGLDGAEADYRLAVERFAQLGRTGSELKALLGLGSVLLAAGRLEDAGKLFDDVHARARASGSLDLLETALSKLSGVHLQRGAFDRGLVVAHEALDQSLHLGDPHRTLVNRCRLAEALIGVGRPAEAVELLRETLGQPSEQVEPDMIDQARMLLAGALLEIPGTDTEAVRAPLARSIAGFRERRKERPLCTALVLELERLVAQGAAEPVDAVYRELETLIAQAGIEPEPEIRVRAELARGAQLLARGHPAGARDEARSALRQASAADLPALEARAHALLAAALEAQGDVREAAPARADAANRLEAAARRIEDPALRASFLERPAFRGLRARSPAPESESRRVLALYAMIRALNSEHDPGALLDSILDMAIGAVNAERGMILLREPGGDFGIHAARTLEAETHEDARRFSRSIVEQAGGGESILAFDAGNDPRFRALRSVSLYGIRSLMCVPLVSRGTIIGTVYLDSRCGEALFTQQDLRFVEAFADHAALALDNARERAALAEENRRLREVAEGRSRFGDLIGRSAAMRRVYELIEKVAATNLPVLIEGESGTGKELVARAIHFHGPRKRRVFLCENCAAIPETLLESEIFGHVRGAFTGAERDRQGLFEQADGGTLFLDEVGDMSPGMQARLLRVLQEGELRRVGGDRPLKVDVRLLAATHRDLRREVEAGRFREDLLYRLQVVPIRLPSLRERPEDIPLLVDHLLERIARERGRPTPTVERAVRVALEAHPWPGNVRQLENTLQRLTLLAGDRPVGVALVEADDQLRSTLLGGTTPPPFSLAGAEREEIQRALQASGGNRQRAARLLGLSRATIYRKIKTLGLE